MGRGIDLVVTKTGVLVRRKNLYPKVPTWNSNTKADTESSGEESSFGKLLSTDLHNTIESLLKSKTVALHSLVSFRSNGNLIKAEEVKAEGSYCVFRIKENSWSLLTVGAKTAKDIRLLGYDSNNQSYLPILINKKDNVWTLQNIL